MNAKTGFACGDCGEFYVSRDDAQTCCQPTPYTSYQCTECKEPYLYQAEAEECCKEQADA
jgi:hypothetical protein